MGADPGAEIVRGSLVELHLALTLGDGTEALSTFDEAPLRLRIGDGTLDPGLEEPLLGLGAGSGLQVPAVEMGDGEVPVGKRPAGLELRCAAETLDGQVAFAGGKESDGEAVVGVGVAGTRRHCRAEAQPDPDPLELSFEEGVGLN